VVSSLLYSFSFTHAPRAAPSFSWTAGCQLEKRKRKKILAPFEITYSSLRILHRLLLISDSKDSNGPLRCFQPLKPIALGALLRQACCQSIDTTLRRGRGVCADAFMSRRTIVVPDVEAYPGHIARDKQTKSEIVCPLILRSLGKEVGLGVFDRTAWRKPASMKTIGPAWRR
jgi:hypothetical protein